MDGAGPHLVGEVHAGQGWRDRRARDRALLRWACSSTPGGPRRNEPGLGADEGLTTWLREQLPDPACVGIERALCHQLAGDLVGPLAAVRIGSPF